VLPLWTQASQANLYETIGYQKRIVRPDGSVWVRPAETDRFLYNWDQRIHCVVCPARASKSYSAAKKALPLVLGRELGDDAQSPRPTRGWIVGPTYELAEKEFRYLYDDLCVKGVKMGWPKPLLSRDSKKGGDLYILTAWGSEIVGKSADKPQSLLGEQLDWVLLSEAAQLAGDIWTRYLEPRLSTTRGYAILPTTPDAGALWLHELYTKGLEGSGTIASYSWDVTGNPIYPIEEFEEKKAFYGENHPVFQEQYLGKWTFYSGVVYGNDFDIHRNMVDVPAGGIPPEWRRIRAIDFGYRDPFVCLWFAVTPDGGLILYREYYQPGRAMADHAKTILELSRGEQILYTVADSSEPQSISDLRRLGVPALSANRDRRAGRMLVGDYLRSGRLQFGRGVCPNTMRELSFYRWDKDKDKEGAKEATVGDDHAMDAMRYALMSRPQPARSLSKIPRGSFAAELRTMQNERARKLWAMGAV
jgi:phage terminase large subunit